MKMCVTIVVFFTLFGVTPLVSGQKASCACEKEPPSNCSGTVSCPDGCSALCGAKDVCFLSCGRHLLNMRLTVKFENQGGAQIATALSARTNMKIRFIPYAKYAQERYDLEINNDGIWNALNFLSKHGEVTVNGSNFSNLRKLRKAMRDSK